MTIAAVPEEVPALVRVPNPDDMDDVTFCKHLNARHADGLPDGFTLSTDPELTDEYVAECWRLWHERMHRMPVYDGSGFRRPEFDHTHKVPKERTR
jgi:hypothetical protein